MDNIGTKDLKLLKESKTQRKKTVSIQVLEKRDWDRGTFEER